jgi:hypothetical protein
MDVSMKMGIRQHYHHVALPIIFCTFRIAFHNLPINHRVMIETRARQLKPQVRVPGRDRPALRACGLPGQAGSVR